MFVYLNVNPDKIRTFDCVIRGVSFVTGRDWDTTMLWIAIWCTIIHRMPEENVVWSAYLKSLGFKRYLLPDTCPDCYTVKDFCRDYPEGTYLLMIIGYDGMGGHVVAVKDGNYFDTWDSGNEVPTYFWVKEN